MVYHGTFASEQIIFYLVDQPNEAHWIALTKSADEPTFVVTCCCDPTWYYEFSLENNSIYERIKMTIMDEIVDCEGVEELLYWLSDVFEHEFEDILIKNEDDDDCDFSKYLN